MRFLILTQYFAPEAGAAPARLTALARQLVEFGHEVEVVTSLPNYPIGRIFPEYRQQVYQKEWLDGVPVHRVWTYASQGAGLRRVANYGAFALSALIGLAKSARPDFIFVESPPLSVSFPAFLASVGWKRPIIFNVSDLWPDSAIEFQLMREGWLTRRIRSLELRSYRRAKYVCAVTEGIRDGLRRKGVQEEKLLFLPNGVDEELFAPAPPDEGLRNELSLAGKNVVLYAGTMGYAHHVQSVIRAAARLRDDPSIHFLMVGGGSVRSELMSLARQWQLPNITFRDPVSQGQVPRLLSISLCGLVTVADKPILHTARSAKAACIMACAKPVVLAMGKNGRHVIQQAEAGIVVPIDQPEEMANAIRFLAANPREAARLGQNGRKYVSANLTWRRLVADFLAQLTDAELRRSPAGVGNKERPTPELLDKAA